MLLPLERLESTLESRFRRADAIMSTRQMGRDTKGDTPPVAKGEENRRRVPSCPRLSSQGNNAPRSSIPFVIVKHDPHEQVLPPTDGQRMERTEFRTRHVEPPGGEAAGKPQLPALT